LFKKAVCKTNVKLRYKTVEHHPRGIKTFQFKIVGGFKMAGAHRGKGPLYMTLRKDERERDFPHVTSKRCD